MGIIMDRHNGKYLFRDFPLGAFRQGGIAVLVATIKIGLRVSIQALADRPSWPARSFYI
jgi:hypothetical protein